jgi:alkaline phosphatase
MVEASRIDHAGHANDPAGHIHDTLMYNDVMNFVKSYIDSHPNTQMLSAADHECGGLTLEDDYSPPVLTKPTKTTEWIVDVFDRYEGEDKSGELKKLLVDNYGLNPSDDDIALLLANETNLLNNIGHLLARAAGINWLSAGHTAADVLLHGYANGGALSAMKEKMSRNHDNSELPVYIVEHLGLDLATTTQALRKDGVEWIEKRDRLDVIKREAKTRIHSHHVH